MEKERYLNYISPNKPHLNWTDQELFDEVDFITTHKAEINPTGERAKQLKGRLACVVLEQVCRYTETHGN